MKTSRLSARSFTKWLIVASAFGFTLAQAQTITLEQMVANAIRRHDKSITTNYNFLYNFANPYSQPGSRPTPQAKAWRPDSKQAACLAQASLLGSAIANRTVDAGTAEDIIAELRPKSSFMSPESFGFWERVIRAVYNLLPPKIDPVAAEKVAETALPTAYQQCMDNGSLDPDLVMRNTLSQPLQQKRLADERSSAPPDIGSNPLVQAILHPAACSMPDMAFLAAVQARQQGSAQDVWLEGYRNRIAANGDTMGSQYVEDAAAFVWRISNINDDGAVAQAKDEFERQEHCK